MQLLHSHPVSSSLSGSLLETLQDITQSVTFDNSFRISHSACKPIELSEETIAYCQRLPLELQHKYLNLELRDFLYGFYYNGAARNALTLKAETADSVAPANLENNSSLGVDLQFFQQIHQSNYGTGYFDAGWTIMQQIDETHFSVVKQGLTLQIERDCHLQPSEQTAAIGDRVAIRKPRNLIQSGFYVAVGNAGLSEADQPSTARLYFHFTAEGAIAVMASLTQALNQIEIPFRFKVLYNPADYQRYDSGVLYIDRSHYALIRPALQTIYSSHREHFQPENPLFTKPLAPGLAIAEEPDHKFAERESFGMNRCQLVANGLMQAWLNGETMPDERLKRILQNFSQVGINVEYSFLNADSDDIYTALVD